ncbi:ATP-binding protein [Streptomyces sp. PA5.6]|uniref:ATP-binding protein n=1 Tax=Streptomyces sp. PA5.6 TaxID=3035651 RepID=UPI003904A631
MEQLHGNIRGLTMTLDVDPQALQDVRERVRRLLAHHRDEDLLDAALVIVTELLTNVHKHTAERRAELDLAPSADELKIVVGDLSEAKPVLQQCDEDAVSGRGMALIDALADRWWVVPNSGGKELHVVVAGVRREGEVIAGTMGCSA